MTKETLFQEIESDVGEWYEKIGEYAVAEKPDERCRIKAGLSEQGCTLLLSVPGKPSVLVHIERLADTESWRLNISPNETDIEAEVEIGPDGVVSLNP